MQADRVPELAQQVRRALSNDLNAPAALAEIDGFAEHSREQANGKPQDGAEQFGPCSTRF